MLCTKMKMNLRDCWICRQYQTMMLAHRYLELVPTKWIALLQHRGTAAKISLAGMKNLFIPMLTKYTTMMKHIKQKEWWCFNSYTL